MDKQYNDRLSDFTLHVVGRWRSHKRQVVEIRYKEELLGSLDLGPARWAVLAALVREAYESGGPETASAYLTSDEIAGILQTVESPYPHASHVKGYLHDLRVDLDVFLQGHLGETDYPGGWGAFLIRTHTLGYYVAVPRTNLQLTTIDRRQPT